MGVLISSLGCRSPSGTVRTNPRLLIFFIVLATKPIFPPLLFGPAMKKKSSKSSTTKKASKKRRTSKREPEQFQRLSEEQQQQPIKVLDSFFDCYSLRGLRPVLWDWLSVAMSAKNSVYDEGHNRSNLIYLYEQIEALFEASYLIHTAQVVKTSKHKKKK